MYCGNTGNRCLAQCTFEIQRFLGRDIGVHRYVLVPRLVSAMEIVAIVGGVDTGVLW